MLAACTRNFGVRRWVAPALAVAAAGLLLAGAACRTGDLTPDDGGAGVIAGPAPRVVEWGASEYAYSAPETLPFGWVTLRMTNHGQEPHHGQLLRLEDGVTFEGFVEALQREGEGALRLTALVGGPALIDPHRTDEVTLDLRPGTYVLACFVSGADGTPHLAKGMLKRLEVTADDRSEAPPPVARGTFTLRDFAFEMPGTMRAGRATYRVVNAGPQPHELVVVKLAEATPVEAVQAWFKAPEGPPPFEAVGGINGLGPGRAGYATLDLEPGDYAAICLIPDRASGISHLHLGMIKGFTAR
jgi:hypothetical protein